MVDFAHFEGRPVAPGAQVLILVSRKLGPAAAIPLHALPEEAAVAILRQHAGPRSAHLGASAALVYLVGEGAFQMMRGIVGVPPGAPWPDNVDVMQLHG